MNVLLSAAELKEIMDAPDVRLEMTVVPAAQASSRTRPNVSEMEGNKTARDS